MPGSIEILSGGNSSQIWNLDRSWKSWIFHEGAEVKKARLGGRSGKGQQGQNIGKNKIVGSKKNRSSRNHSRQGRSTREGQRVKSKRWWSSKSSGRNKTSRSKDAKK